MTTTVSHLLATKGTDVWSVTPATTVYQALATMADKEVGALLVIDGGRLVGVMSERDYARKVILLDRLSRETTVAEIMTTAIHTVATTDSVVTCMTLMTEHRVRHLPVVDDGGDVVGVISIGDAVKAVIEDQRFLIEQLESYITS